MIASLHIDRHFRGQYLGLSIFSDVFNRLASFGFLRIQLLECCSVAILALVASHFDGIPAMFATMRVIILAMTGTVLPGLVARAPRG